MTSNLNNGSSWRSYPSIFALGHKAIADLLKHPVTVEEKVDGSQFSFGVVESDGDNVYEPGLSLRVRSKGAVMHPDAPEKMFSLGVAHVKSIQHLLHPGWTYRGEYLAKPRHNALAYDRVPAGHVILFDINTGEEEYLSYEDKAVEAARLGLEVVPRLFEGVVPDVASFRQFLDTVSCLGGQKIEGVVVKPLGYNLYGWDKKVLLGKFVSEAYKEVHNKTWKLDNPSKADVIAHLGSTYCTAARWNKAIQHLREAGKLTDSPRDIGMIIREVPEDILKEEEQAIKDKLFAYAWPQIKRAVVAGLPEYYKDQLLRLQFEREDADGGSSDSVGVCVPGSGDVTGSELVGASLEAGDPSGHPPA